MDTEVIYHSVATEGLSSEDIINLVKKAQAFNKTKGITGCLLYYENEFVQALEGEETVINALLVSIERDPRHSEMHVLYKNKCESRSYSNWNMAYDALDNSDIQKVESAMGIKDFQALHALKDSPSRVKKIFSFLSKELINGSGS